MFDDLGQPTKASYLVSVTDGSNNYVEHNTTIEAGLAYSMYQITHWH